MYQFCHSYRTRDGRTHAFHIDPKRKHDLLLGVDDIAATLKLEKEIARFEAKLEQRCPWLADLQQLQDLATSRELDASECKTTEL